MNTTYLFNSLFVFLGACLVFFMQAGFALLEAGLARSKNTTNVLFKNVMDFGFGTIAFTLVGFGLMYGADAAGIICTTNFINPFSSDMNITDLSPYMYFFFQLVFCAATATIVSGAVAGRTKFSSYLICSFLISAFIYPVSGHWLWGGGWLSKLGYLDFAGSSVVHMAGGIIGLMGAIMVGPRIGKFNKDGSANAIQGHNISLATTGMFILFLGWYGFNPGSELAFDEDAMYICLTTTMSAATASITTLLLTWKFYGKPDLSMVLNGLLGGLVAITAGCKNVSIPAAAIIGIIGACVIVIGVPLVDKLHVDDPVGAVSVHGLCGATGTLCVGLFASRETDMLGLFYGGGLKLLGIQIIGVVSIMAWCSIASLIMFKIIKSTIGLRVTKEEELTGLDIKEHGVLAYPEYELNNIESVSLNTSSTTIPSRENIVPMEFSVTVDDRRKSGNKISNVVMIFNQDKLAALKDGMSALGVSGITITQVMGYGIQKGGDKMYRGVPIVNNILPKVKVEFIVGDIPIEKVIQTAKSILYTGSIGDGKIFVYDVENVIKVRTGEEGIDALRNKAI